MPRIFTPPAIAYRSFFVKLSLPLIFLFSSLGFKIQAQSPFCNDATQMCPDQGATTYRATTGAGNAAPGNNYGCLGSQPNPAWFFLNVASTGAATIELTNSNNRDIDFAMWGPFPNLAAALANCGSLPAPADCSFSPFPNETVDFPPAAPGSIFLLMVTNFSNQPTDITANDPQFPNSVFSCDPPPPSCEADGGAIPLTPIMECFQSPDLNLSLPPVYGGPAPNPANFSYTYLISDASGNIIAIDAGPNLTNTPPGTYEVCGLSFENIAAPQLPSLIGQNINTVRNDLNGATPPFCGDVTQNCVDVTISTPPPPTNLPNVSICSGDCTPAPDGGQICSGGSYSFTLTSSTGCDSIVNLTVIETPPSSSNISVDICPGECVVVAGQFVCGPGPAIVNTTAANGCDSVITVNFNVIQVDAVIFPNPPDQLACDNLFVNLDGSFSTPGASLVWQDLGGNQLGVGPILVVSQTGNYTLVASVTQNGKTCTDQVSVNVTGDTTPPDIETNDTPEICDGEFFDLATVNVIDVTGTSPVLTYHSSTPANLSNQIGSVVSPSFTTTYYILATANGCTDEIPVTVTVNMSQATSISVEVCEGDCVIVGGQQVCAPGPEVVFLQTSKGCDSIVTVNFNEIFVNADIFPNPPPDLTCDMPVVTLDGSFSTPGAVLNWFDPFGNFIGSGPFIDVTQPGSYSMDAVINQNGLSCQSSITVIVGGSTLPPDIITFDDPSVCLGESFDLQAIGVFDNNNQNPTLTYHSGTPANQFNEINSQVTPFATTTYYILATANGCTDELPVTVTVSDAPEFFILDQPVICQGDAFDLRTLQLNFTGTVGTITYHDSSPAGPFNQLFGSLVSPPISTSYYLLADANGCTYEQEVIVGVNPTPDAFFEVENSICILDAATVNYLGSASPNATFTWDFDDGAAVPGAGIGPHTVQWFDGGDKIITLTVEENGCTSTQEFSIVTVEEAPVEPFIDCQPFLDSIIFEWADNNPGGYFVEITTGQSNFVQETPSRLVVRGLQNGEIVSIRVTALGGGVCPDAVGFVSCQAIECPDITVAIDPIDSICLTAATTPVQLSVVVTGSDGTGSGYWVGTGITDSLTGIFDPRIAGAGNRTVSYRFTENSCVETGSAVVTISRPADPVFALPDEICLGDTATVTYTGNATLPAVFNWNFAGANAIPGSGIGPHRLVWDVAGTKILSLVVDKNSCPSGIFTDSIRVIEPLEPPAINCLTFIDSIIFSWTPDPAVANYNVLLDGNSVTALNPLVVRNLQPGDQATIEVTANSGGPCPPVQSVLTCTAEDCPDFQISIQSVAPICLNSAATPFNLFVSVGGGMGSGSGVWSGIGITDPIAGTFDPNLAGAGVRNVRYTYTEGSCQKFEDLEIIILPQPSASFLVAGPICVSDTAWIQYDGGANTMAVFRWNFNGGNAPFVSKTDPFPVIFSVAGQYNLELTVTQDNCASEVFSVPLQVDALLLPPVIRCTETVDSIIFEWDPVSNSNGYEIFENGNSAGLQNTTQFISRGLMPGDAVTIDVDIFSNNSCPPIRVSQTCVAQNCPEFEVVFQPVDTICLDQNAAPVSLMATVSNGLGGGDFDWSGTAVSAIGIFDPAQAGAGLWRLNFHYAEGNCSVDTFLEVLVQALPSSEFTALSPVCEGGFSEIALTGNVPPNAQFSWDFQNPASINNNGPENYLVAWNTAGSKTISLTVQDGQCVSAQTARIVEVFAELVAPSINCTPTTSSVLFNWPTVFGATNYEVQVLDLPPGANATRLDDFNMLFENLAPEDSVRILLEVFENGSPCPPVQTVLSCASRQCPPVVFDLQTLPDSCLAAGDIFSSQLSVNLTGGNPGGTIAWSGSNVSSSGIFETNLPGDYRIVYTYSEQNCFYADSTILKIYPVPDADFEVDPVICAGSIATINFTGTSLPGLNYFWDVPGGSPSQLTGPGPHRVTFAQSGSARIGLFTEANGCRSVQQFETLQIDTPLALPQVQCTSSPTSVEFCWNADPAVSDYQVSISSGQTGNQTGNCILFDQIIPNTEISITLTATGASACGPVVVNATCSADDCPDVNLFSQPVPPVCLTDTARAFSVQPFVSADFSDGTPLWSWSGAGVNTTGVFDPRSVGTGRQFLTVNYTLYGICNYEKEIEVVVNPLPLADAGADQTLDCAFNAVEIGGSANAGNAPTVRYQWLNGIVDEPDFSNTATSRAGVYILQSEDAISGCVAFDTVEIFAATNFPDLSAVLENISCFGRNDGVIRVDSVENGEGPFLFAFNNEIFGQQDVFRNLGPGTYTVLVQDANFCKDSVSFTITQPDPASVQIVMYLDNQVIPDNGTIEWGDSIELEAFTNFAPELLTLVDWEPEGFIPNCDGDFRENCLVIRAAPTGRTEFSIRIANENGCPAEDRTTINVVKTRPVYIPSAFSPNDQNSINDMFLIYADPQIVTRVKSFLIFDRWGETVFENYNFPPAPIDNNHGWDGSFRGEFVNPAVFVYFAEVEFADGTTELYKGDVTVK